MLVWLSYTTNLSKQWRRTTGLLLLRITGFTQLLIMQLPDDPICQNHRYTRLMSQCNKKVKMPVVFKNSVNHIIDSHRYTRLVSQCNKKVKMPVVFKNSVNHIIDSQHKWNFFSRLQAYRPREISLSSPFAWEDPEYQNSWIFFYPKQGRNHNYSPN